MKNPEHQLSRAQLCRSKKVLENKSFPATVLASMLLMIASAAFAKIPLPLLESSKSSELSGYLRQNWMSPEDYVVSKFKDHDIVFLGEYHRIRHDAQFVQDLIPLLYEVGVRNLGIELGDSDCQGKVDGLLNAPEYNEQLSRQLFFNLDSAWGYVEYEDLYRAAWRLNRSLAPGAPKFRIINLCYKLNSDFRKQEKSMTDADWQKVFWKGDYDEYMAKVILKEFVEKREKALVYSGLAHSFTRYQEPLMNKPGQFLKRTGNFVEEKIGDRVFNILLHCPGGSGTTASYPADGVIDRVMCEFKNTRVGFDLKGTPFGTLKDHDCIGHGEQKLADLYDGYVFQEHFSRYKGCRVDQKFISQANFAEALKGLPPYARGGIRSPSELLHEIQVTADMKRRFRELK
jgi:hypothetical protein